MHSQKHQIFKSSNQLDLRSNLEFPPQYVVIAHSQDTTHNLHMDYKT